MSFMLNPTHSTPPRLRSTDNVEHGIGEIVWYKGDGSPQINTHPFSEGRESHIWDHGPYKKGKSRWYSVIHRQRVYERGSVDALSSDACPWGWSTGGCSSYEPTSDDLVPDRVDIVGSQLFSDALADMTEEYYSKLYTFQPSQLPDMAVFTAELRETMQVANLIYSYASQLRGYIMRKKALREKLGKIDLDIRRSLREKRFAYARRLELEKRGIMEMLNDLANLILSWRFGVMAPLRDFQKLITSCYEYWDVMKFCPTTEHIRRIIHIDDSVVSTYGTASWCPSASSCPGCRGFNVGDEVKIVDSTSEVELTCVADFTNVIKGTTVEQVVYSLLSAFGLMPDIMSIWEMTKLSWAVDYFVRLNHIFTRFAGVGGFGFHEPIIHQTSVGLKITSTVTENLNKCPVYSIYNLGSVKEVYYERLAGVSPFDLTSLVRLIRAPSFNQGVNAAALLTQLLLSPR